VEGLEGVRGISAEYARSYAWMQSGDVYQWGASLLLGGENALHPSSVEAFGEGVRVCHVCAGESTAFAIGEDGEVSTWGQGEDGLLGHGDMEDQPSPKRVEALRGVRMSSVSVGYSHGLALSEDGLVYEWGGQWDDPELPHLALVEALRGVRVGSVAVGGDRSYSLAADAGELWAWGCDRGAAYEAPNGHRGQDSPFFMPKPIESLRGIKVDAVVADEGHTLALADDGSLYAWGNKDSAASGALGLGRAVSEAGMRVPTPQRVHALRVGI
jgi:alpha-tubulin suppressor-like RCC1 family protein